MSNKNKGLSMVELIVVLGIMAIISLPLLRILKVTLDYWDSGQESLQTSMDMHYLLTSLIIELNQIQTVTDIADLTNEAAYIQYTDEKGDANTIFLNTVENQELLSLSNNFEEDDIVYIDKDGVSSPLISNVLLFKLQSFREKADFIRAVTPNNIVDGSYDEINSLRFSIQTKVNDRVEYLEQLVDVARDTLEFSGSVEFGATENLLAEYEENGYELDNMAIEVDGDGVSYLTLIPRDETVKILNTGEYFSTISDALSAAVSGDIVLVGYREDGYVENLIIPEGVSLYGGYDPVTWLHDPQNRKVDLTSQSGILFQEGSVLMNSNTLISGFSINGQNLQYAILALNIDNIKIINNEIADVDNPIYVEGVNQAEIYGNSVTANQYSLYLNAVENAVIFRNRFNSNNALLKENVVILNSELISFVNNLITNGYYCFRVTASTSVDIVNNIFSNAQNFGVLIKNLASSTFKNNVVMQNNVGISIISSEAGVFSSADINYNLFLNNTYGHTLDLALDATNIQDTISDFEMNFANPYFVDLNDFELLQTSVLIDGGAPVAEYNDMYFDDNPSKGIARNDIGLYGGQFAGRVGYPYVIALDLDNTGQVLTLLNESYQGDVFTLPEGSFDLDISFDMKPFQVISGEGSFTTVLSNLSGASLFNVANDNILSNFMIESVFQDAITVDIDDDVIIRNLFVTGEQSSILVSDGLARLYYNSFHLVNSPVIVQNDANITFSYNVVNEAVTGLTNQSSSTVLSQNNIFTSVDTLYSGLVSDTNDLAQDESVFWDEDSGIYILSPTSNAVEIDTIRDAGALGFYEDSGSILFSQINSNVDRQYSSIVFDYLAETGNKFAVSAIYVEFIDGTASLLMDDYIVIDQETATSNTLTLPNNIVSDSLFLKVYFYSYTFNHTPIVDTITLSW